MAKYINDIIAPYCPSKYTCKSSYEFVDLVRSQNVTGKLASLDVESLFTNVPVNETISIICEYVYKNENMAPPAIPEQLLRDALAMCTLQSPFRHPNGKLYLQVDGVAMGSPLGPTFANFYMGHVEEIVFASYPKPTIYIRYVDDIFLMVDSVEDITLLRERLQENSVLHFTYELFEMSEPGIR